MTGKLRKTTGVACAIDAAIDATAALTAGNGGPAEICTRGLRVGVACVSARIER
ncbi:MAG: hypothetical protein QOH00_213 [Gaiellales bacterium]|jgi:hypothetical protein|nr:hypothetical protein [Gaiellales bacterium]